jgi:hypothetical protein
VCGCHPVSRQKARLTAGLLCFSLAGGLSACGVSTEVYTRTLQERDQLRDRTGRAETEVAVQRKQAADLRAALTEQQQADHTLRARVAELEALTADQNLAQEALTRQLRSLTAEREELLLRLDEAAPRPGPPNAAAAGGARSTGDGDAVAQRLIVALHDAIEAGHLTVHRLAHGLDLRLAESFLFVPDTTELTFDGQGLLSAIGAVLSGVPPHRLQLRLLLPDAGAEGAPEQTRGGRAMAFNRLLELARQFNGRAESSELVFVAPREGPSPAQTAAPPEQAIPAGKIQVLLEWPVVPSVGP